MPQPDIEQRLEELREFYPSDEHQILDEALETIKELRRRVRRVTYGQRMQDEIQELNPEAQFLEGMDEALVGYAVQWGSPPLPVYDGEKIVEILAKDMGFEEAAEHFSFNIECAYVGSGTPLILHRPELD